MGKKKKKYTQQQISSYLFDDYIHNREMIPASSMLKDIDYIID